MLSRFPAYRPVRRRDGDADDGTRGNSSVEYGEHPRRRPGDGFGANGPLSRASDDGAHRPIDTAGHHRCAVHPSGVDPAAVNP